MPPARDLRDALRALPCGARLLDAAGDGGDAWLVGGAVRDLMLGREPRELDVAVEGPITALAGRLGDPLRAHERFGTATVLDHGCRFDLAATRAESYAEPGALPDVRPAGIDEDLVRRDFTVNALAMRLRDGELRGAGNALEDLEAGRLRVLHDASFTDDPTRLWRLARYAGRLGFAPDERTRALAAVADPSTVSGTRHGNELRLTLAEPDPPAALELLARLNALVLPDGFAPRPAGLDEALSLLPEGEGRRDLLTLAACVRGLALPRLLAWLGDLGFRAEERDLVAAASRESTWAPLRVASTRAEIGRAARGAPLEAVALAGGDNAAAWLGELRHVGLEITGDDLLAAGVPQGPQVGERLRRVLDRKLDGELAGREEELAAALE